MALCLGILPAVCGSQRTAERFTGQFTGRVGGSPVRMTLQRQGSQVTGTYRYVRAGVSLRLEGVCEGNRARIREIFGARTQTGILTAHAREDGSLEGIWTKPDGSGALTLYVQPLASPLASSTARLQKTRSTQTHSVSQIAPVPRRSHPVSAGQTSPASSAGDDFLRAVRQGDTARARSLLEQNAPLNARDSQGRTALMLVCSFRNDGSEGASFASLEERLEFVRFLLARGIDVNAHSEQGYTPLMYATASWGAGDPLLRMLLKAGADVNARNGHGGTALMMAVGRYGHVSTVQLLTEAGANVKMRDNAGRSALWYAKSHHAPSSARILENAGAVE